MLSDSLRSQVIAALAAHEPSALTSHQRTEATLEAKQLHRLLGHWIAEAAAADRARAATAEHTLPRRFSPATPIHQQPTTSNQQQPRSK